jgi:MFS family permease
LLGVGLAGLGDFSNTLLILWATQAFREEYGIEQVATLAVLLHLGYNIIYLVCGYVSGILADRFPKKWVLAIGYSLAAIPAVMLLLPGDSLLKFATIFGFSGLYMVCGRRRRAARRRRCCRRKFGASASERSRP